MVCAPTGMAALNCGGKTLHSAFRIRPKDYFENGSYGEEEPTWLHRYDTLHKSQGQTYDCVNVEPSVFETGQLYVALSRCKTIEGLHLLKKIDSDKLQISEKVKSFYERFGCNPSITENEVQERLPDVLCNNESEVVDIKKQVGFDRIEVALIVESINLSFFPPRMHNEKKAFKCTYNRTDEERKKLEINGVKIPYSYIRIELGANELVIKKNNTKKGGDICLLTVYVNPMYGHEELGNIRNFSALQEQIFVRNLMKYIEMVYGIKFKEGEATIRDAEININLKWGESFDDVYKAIKVVAPYIGKEFDCRSYVEPKTKNQSSILGMTITLKK